MEDQNVVLMLNLTPAIAKRMIADIITDSSRVLFTDHAEKRMKKRKITRVQVINCLKNGVIREGPFRDIKGNWELTIETLSAGCPITVVAALDRDENGNYIIIITTY